MPNHPTLLHIKTSEARERLAWIIDRVQDPRHSVLLTRYGRSVAAVVSVTEFYRLEDQDRRDRVINGELVPSGFTYGKGLEFYTNKEAAEHVQKLQMTRRMEREILTRAGLECVPGGELVEDVEIPPVVVPEEESLAEPEEESVTEPVTVRARRWWWFW